LNEDLIKVQTVSGFYKADQFEPILKFFGSGKYKNTKYDDYLKNFIAEVK
jgi:thioredoxin-related protein